MASTAPIVVPSPNASAEPPPRPAMPERTPPPSTDPDDKPQMTRLLIQEVEGRYVYTVVDRETGRVLTQLPRQAVQEMGGLEDYSAGTVVNTQA